MEGIEPGMEGPGPGDGMGPEGTNEAEQERQENLGRWRSVIEVTEATVTKNTQGDRLVGHEYEIHRAALRNYLQPDKVLAVSDATLFGVEAGTSLINLAQEQAQKGQVPQTAALLREAIARGEVGNDLPRAYSILGTACLGSAKRAKSEDERMRLTVDGSILRFGSGGERVVGDMVAEAIKQRMHKAKS